jgi:hypothetical protein
MAIKTNLTLQTGTDHRYEFAILDSAQTAAVDISGWALSWMLKRTPQVADAQASLVKSTTVSGITITGTYDASPATNTQRAAVDIADTDTDPLPPSLYFYELKRMDAGLEAVLAYGNLVLVQSIHRQ